MKRPLFWAGISFLSATAVFLSVETPLVSAVCALGVLLLCVLLSGCKSRGALLLFACALLAADSLFLHAALQRAYLSPLIGREATVALAVSETQRRGSGTVCAGMAKIRAGDAVRLAPVEVISWDGGAQTGEVLRFAARIGFSTDAALGEPLALTLREALSEREAPAAPAFFLRLYRLRAWVCRAACEMVSGEARGILCAVLAGDKTRLSGGVTASFRRAGLSHLLVVSGMHLCVAAALAKRLFGFLSAKKRFFIVACLVWSFAALTGFGVSAVRAAVMVTLAQCAALFHRKSDTLTSLSFAGVCIVLCSPAAVVSVSFLLSFSAVLGIALFSEPIEKWLSLRLPLPEKPKGTLCALLSVSAAAQLGTLPVTAVCFGTAPVLGLAANLVAVPLLSPLLLCGALGVALLPLRALFGPICQAIIDVLCLLAKGFAAVPFAQLGLGERWLLLWALGVCALCTLCVIFPPTGLWRRLTALCGAVVLFGCALFSLAAAQNTVTVVFFPEENAVAVIRGHSAVLLGAPQSEHDADTIASSLSRQNVAALEAVVASERTLPDALFSLTKAFPTNGIAAPDTPANRILCHAAGETLCKTEGLLLFGRYPAEFTDGSIVLTIDEDGAALCPSEGICVIMNEYFTTLPALTDGAARVRIFDRRTP